MLASPCENSRKTFHFENTREISHFEDGRQILKRQWMCLKTPKKHLNIKKHYYLAAYFTQIWHL